MTVLTGQCHSFTGLMTSLLKGLKDAVLPTAAKTDTVTHLLNDSMGMFYSENELRSLPRVFPGSC